MAQFINPYNFVRIPGVSRNYRAISHDNLRNWEGELSCELETVTPTLVQSAKLGDSLSQGTDNGGNPIIPSPSIRGMIRNIFETITASCDPNGSNSCQDPDHCCLACSVFGMVLQDSHHMGHVRFSDAMGTPSAIENPHLTLPRVGPPRSRHKPFYYENNHQRGRKFYYHHDPDTASWDNSGSRIALWIKRGKGFSFKTRFSGLDDNALAALLFSLRLEPGLGHKIGHGKPLGLGSCTISIQNAWFRNFMVNEEYDDPSFLDEQINEIVTNDRLNDTIDDLRIILRLPANHPSHYNRAIRYPSYIWFYYDRLSTRKMLLPTIQDVESNVNMLDESLTGRKLMVGMGTKFGRSDVIRIRNNRIRVRLPKIKEFEIPTAIVKQLNDQKKPNNLQEFMKEHKIEIEIIDPRTPKIGIVAFHTI